MNYETFEKIILLQQLALKRSQELYKLKIDLMEVEEPFHQIIDELTKECFNEEQVGWIDWFLYEREGMRGELNKAHDKDGSEICHTIESLWKTVKEAG